MPRLGVLCDTLGMTGTKVNCGMAMCACARCMWMAVDNPPGGVGEPGLPPVAPAQLAAAARESAEDAGGLTAFAGNRNGRADNARAAFLLRFKRSTVRPGPPRSSRKPAQRVFNEVTTPGGSFVNSLTISRFLALIAIEKQHGLDHHAPRYNEFSTTRHIKISN
jgi:hypothetical protein